LPDDSAEVRRAWPGALLQITHTTLRKQKLFGLI
jgi:hypothetical protein